ncbi:MAG: DUF790 family protein [Planctomycetes bacterium]|nr:DUF790 family protein [Planctomycetota bacterium]
MLSKPLLRYEVRGGKVDPAYADGRCVGLVRALVERYEASAGRRYGELELSLERLPEAAPYDRRLVLGLRRVIEEAMDLAVGSPVPPRRLRAAVFERAALSRDLEAPRVFREAAAALGVAGQPIEPWLYGDLRSERIVTFPEALPAVERIIARYNFRLVQGLLFHSDRVRVEADGQVRAIYRLAKLHGLIVEVRSPPPSRGGLRIEVTGPLSLFQRTLKYGRALAAFLPACAIASRFRVEARLFLRGASASLTITQDDEVLSPHREPRAFDSAVEERFFRDFTALGSRWDIRREERLVQAGDSVFFPDFTFRLRTDPGVRVDLEIVGFWTRDYLARKRAIMERVAGSPTIFCVDERLSCGREAAPVECIPFSGRVPPEKVLEVLERIAGDADRASPDGASKKQPWPTA